ncbi:hypothetical protein KM043_009837 [Ampulex compressa]|nr:hypothetical protein KM043_009837 [Ampulex compressa]
MNLKLLKVQIFRIVESAGKGLEGRHLCAQTRRTVFLKVWCAYARGLHEKSSGGTCLLDLLNARVIPFDCLALIIGGGDTDRGGKGLRKRFELLFVERQIGSQSKSGSDTTRR